MDKLKLREKIEYELRENNGYMVFNVKEDDSGRVYFEPVSFEEWLGIDFPKTFEKKKYPTRITAGLIKAIKLDPEFFHEILEINKRFLDGDWGDNLDGFEDTIEYNDRRPERAQGYYDTTWGEISIKRDNTFTTAFFPSEK